MSILKALLVFLTLAAVQATHGKPKSNANLDIKERYSYKSVRPKMASLHTNIYARTGQPYALDVSAHFLADDAGAPLIFSARNLPHGLHMSLDGIISGVPTTDGTFDVLVSAADDYALKNTEANFNVHVNPYGTSVFNGRCDAGCYTGTTGPCQNAAPYDNRCSQHVDGMCSTDQIDCAIPVVLSSVSTVEVVLDLTLDVDSFLSNQDQQDAMAAALAESLNAPSVVITGVTPLSTGFLLAELSRRAQAACSLDFTAVVPGDSNMSVDDISNALLDASFADNLVSYLSGSDAHVDASRVEVKEVTVQMSGGYSVQVFTQNVFKDLSDKVFHHGADAAAPASEEFLRTAAPASEEFLRTAAPASEDAVLAKNPFKDLANKVFHHDADAAAPASEDAVLAKNPLKDLAKKVFHHGADAAAPASEEFLRTAAPASAPEEKVFFKTRNQMFKRKSQWLKQLN